MTHSVEEEKVDPAATIAAGGRAAAAPEEAHVHFAGRVPAGSRLPICISKNGVNHVSTRSSTAALDCHIANEQFSHHATRCSVVFRSSRRMVQTKISYPSVWRAPNASRVRVSPSYYALGSSMNSKS